MEMGKNDEMNGVYKGKTLKIFIKNYFEIKV